MRRLCKHDQVVGATKSEVVADLFPRSRYVQLPGATHYSFYDRPEHLARMMESFFKESQIVSSHKDVKIVSHNGIEREQMSSR